MPAETSWYPPKTEGEHKVAHKYEYKPNFVKIIVSRHLALISEPEILTFKHRWRRIIYLIAGNLSHSTAGQLLTSWPKPCSSVALRYNHMSGTPQQTSLNNLHNKHKLALRPGDWNNLQPDKIISKPNGGQVIRIPI